VLTNSPLWVGLAAGARGASQILFSLPGGYLVDRMDRRRLLMGTQLIAALGASVLGILVLVHAVRIWQVFVYLAVTGSITAVSRPSLNGLIYDTVGEERLLNASAFQFMATGIVKIFGALAGGLVIDRLGVGQNYLVLAATYLAGTGVLLRLRSPAPAMRVVEPIVQGIVTGLRYAVRVRPIRYLLVLSLIIETFGFSFSAMIPVVARDVLHVGALGMGYLGAMSGVGQFGATVLIASMGTVHYGGRILVPAALGFGLFIILFGLSPWFLASLVLVALVGFMGSTYDSTMSTMLMMLSSNAMRGRVLGLYFSTISVNPVGSLGIGIIASVFGMPLGLAAGGAIVVAGALALLSHLHGLRVPDSTCGLRTSEAATE
jgi:MFS family permease